MKRILDNGFLMTGTGAFIDTDWLLDDRIATVQERNCEACKHHGLDKQTQRYTCEKSKCEFEERGKRNDTRKSK